jgi:hypothetical protein
MTFEMRSYPTRVRSAFLQQRVSSHSQFQWFSVDILATCVQFAIRVYIGVYIPRWICSKKRGEHPPIDKAAKFQLTILKASSEILAIIMGFQQSMPGLSPSPITTNTIVNIAALAERFGEQIPK